LSILTAVMILLSYQARHQAPGRLCGMGHTVGRWYDQVSFQVG
jgi:hypothetical protein